MVYKTQKHSIRTGSSVKNWNTIIFRYLKKPYLHTTVTPYSDKVLNSECKTGMLCKHFTKCQYLCVLNGVEYSLNKRKRWELEQYLTEGILSDEFDETYQVVQLVVRHNMSCFNIIHSTCRYACSSRGIYKHGDITKDCKEKKKEHGYFTEETVLNDAAKTKKEHPSGLKGDSKCASPIIVRYEFVYPSPAKKHLTHTPRCSGPFIDYSDKHYDFQEEFNRQRRKKRLRRWINESIRDMV